MRPGRAGLTESYRQLESQAWSWLTRPRRSGVGLYPRYAEAGRRRRPAGPAKEHSGANNHERNHVYLVCRFLPFFFFLWAPQKIFMDDECYSVRSLIKTSVSFYAAALVDNIFAPILPWIIIRFCLVFVSSAEDRR